MHEQYDRKTFINDIALLKLIKHVNFDQHIQPICLPSSNLVLDGQGAYVAGKFPRKYPVTFRVTRQIFGSQVGEQRRSLVHRVKSYAKFSCQFGNRMNARLLSPGTRLPLPKYVPVIGRAAKIPVKYYLENTLKYNIFVNINLIDDFREIRVDR